MVYCEQFLATAGFEAWNAYSNIGFLVAGIVGGVAGVRVAGALSGSLRVLIGLSLAIGAGSFAWHATGQAWAQWADVIPILCFVLTFLMLALRQLFGCSIMKAGAASAGLFAALVLAIVFAGKALNGSMAYVPVWLALAGVAAAAYRLGSPARSSLATATLLFAISLAFRTVDLRWCGAFPHGTHWLWHLFNSALLAQLMVLLARYGSAARPGATSR